MGFFDFLKSKPEEKEILNLNLAELESWLAETYQNAEKEIAPKLNELNKELSESKEKLKERLAVLESAALKNKELPERIKNLMEGNRRVYIQKMNSLIQKIQFPENLEENIKFCKEFDLYMAGFDKEITKSHMAMSEFFVNEANAVSTTVRTIDQIVKKQKNLFELGKIEKIKEIENELKKIHLQISQKEEFRSKIFEHEKKIKSDEQEIQKKEKELESKLKGEEYKKVFGAINERNSLENEIKEINRNISFDFSEIETALKKYHNASQNKKVSSYLNNPLNALYEDKELEILSILDSAKKAIETGEMEIKDKKKDKIIRVINKLTKEYFEDFLKKQEHLSAQLTELDSEIESAEILKEIKISKEEIEKENYQISEEKTRLDKMKKNLEEADIKNLIKALEQTIIEKLGENIKINF